MHYINITYYYYAFIIYYFISLHNNYKKNIKIIKINKYGDGKTEEELFNS